MPKIENGNRYSNTYTSTIYGPNPNKVVWQKKTTMSTYVPYLMYANKFTLI